MGSRGGSAAIPFEVYGYRVAVNCDSGGVLERSAFRLLGKADLAVSQLRSSLGVFGRSQAYRFATGPEADQSADVLIPFVRKF
jgi:hypothetical protein